MVLPPVSTVSAAWRSRGGGTEPGQATGYESRLAVWLDWQSATAALDTKKWARALTSELRHLAYAAVASSRGAGTAGSTCSI